jgi:hypothetical protein
MNRRARFVHLIHERASGLVHRADRIFIAVVLLSGVPAFVPATRLSTSIGLALSLLVIATLLFKRQHGARLCEQCVTEFTINAPEHAAQHRRRFRLFHTVTPFYLMLLPVAVAPLLEAPWSGVAYLPVVVGQVLLALVTRFHGAYQPWCPYCRRDDGGGDETEPAPDPSGGHGRPLPVT